MKDEPLHKVCSKCHIDKPIDEFRKEKSRGVYRRRTDCKKCKSDAQKLNYHKTHEERLRYAKEYRTANRELVNRKKRENYLVGLTDQEIAEYRQKQKEKTREWFKNNRDRARMRRKEYYHSHRDESIRKTAEWEKKNPERAAAGARLYAHRRRKRLSNTPDNECITVQQWFDLCEKYDNKCLGPGPHMGELTMDHIIPVSKGGSDSVDNIQPLCRHCNAVKFTAIIDYRPK